MRRCSPFFIGAGAGATALLLLVLVCGGVVVQSSPFWTNACIRHPEFCGGIVHNQPRLLVNKRSPGNGGSKPPKETHGTGNPTLGGVVWPEDEDFLGGGPSKGNKGG